MKWGWKSEYGRRENTSRRLGYVVPIYSTWDQSEKKRRPNTTAWHSSWIWMSRILARGNLAPGLLTPITQGICILSVHLSVCLFLCLLPSDTNQRPMSKTEYKKKSKKLKVKYIIKQTQWDQDEELDKMGKCFVPYIALLGRKAGLKLGRYFWPIPVCSFEFSSESEICKCRTYILKSYIHSHL